MILELKNITKSFLDKPVLKDISFKVESGKVMGLLGENGAGKTTVIRILTRVFTEDSGEILIDRQRWNPKDFKVGYLPERVGLYSKTDLFTQLVYISRLKGASRKNAKESADYWMSKFSLEEYKYDTLEKLSIGNRQKVLLAQAFLNSPDILILDEPFKGLDSINSEILMNLIKEYEQEDKIILISSHQMSYVDEICKNIAIIKNGRVILNENLFKYKLSLGKNKIKFKSEDYDIKGLSNRLKVEFKNIEIDEAGNYLIINLINGKKKNDFLKELMEKNISINLFSDFIPTSDEIFLKEVGEHN